MLTNIIAEKNNVDREGKNQYNVRDHKRVLTYFDGPDKAKNKNGLRSFLFFAFDADVFMKMWFPNGSRWTDPTRRDCKDSRWH